MDEPGHNYVIQFMKHRSKSHNNDNALSKTEASRSRHGSNASSPTPPHHNNNHILAKFATSEPPINSESRKRGASLLREKEASLFAFRSGTDLMHSSAPQQPGSITNSNNSMPGSASPSLAISSASISSEGALDDTCCFWAVVKKSLTKPVKAFIEIDALALIGTYYANDVREERKPFGDAEGQDEPEGKETQRERTGSVNGGSTNRKKEKEVIPMLGTFVLHGVKITTKKNKISLSSKSKQVKLVLHDDIEAQNVYNFILKAKECNENEVTLPTWECPNGVCDIRATMSTGPATVGQLASASKSMEERSQSANSAGSITNSSASNTPSPLTSYETPLELLAPPSKSLFGIKVRTAVDGTLESVRSIMNGETTLFVLLRHFGCVLCKKMVMNILEKKHELHQLGINVCCVGNGNVKYARWFCKENNFPLERLYIDVPLALYKGFSCGKNDPGKMFTKEFFTSGRKEIEELHKEMGTETYAEDMGARWILGGVFVVSPKKGLIYQFKSQYLGHLCNVDDLISKVFRFCEEFPEYNWRPTVERDWDTTPLASLSHFEQTTHSNSSSSPSLVSNANTSQAHLANSAANNSASQINHHLHSSLSSPASVHFQSLERTQYRFESLHRIENGPRGQPKIYLHSAPYSTGFFRSSHTIYVCKTMKKDSKLPCFVICLNPRNTRALIMSTSGCLKAKIPFSPPKDVLQYVLSLHTQEKAGVYKIESNYFAPMQNDLVALEKSFLDLNVTASIVNISGSESNKQRTEEENVTSNHSNPDALQPPLTSPGYDRFLSAIGERVSLAHWRHFAGALDCTCETKTGAWGLAANFGARELMFYVDAFLPACATNNNNPRLSPHSTPLQSQQPGNLSSSGNAKDGHVGMLSSSSSSAISTSGATRGSGVGAMIAEPPSPRPFVIARARPKSESASTHHANGANGIGPLQQQVHGPSRVNRPTSGSNASAAKQSTSNSFALHASTGQARDFSALLVSHEESEAREEGTESHHSGTSATTSANGKASQARHPLLFSNQILVAFLSDDDSVLPSELFTNNVAVVIAVREVERLTRAPSHSKTQPLSPKHSKLTSPRKHSANSSTASTPQHSNSNSPTVPTNHSRLSGAKQSKQLKNSGPSGSSTIQLTLSGSNATTGAHNSQPHSYHGHSSQSASNHSPLHQATANFSALQSPTTGRKISLATERSNSNAPPVSPRNTTADSAQLSSSSSNVSSPWVAHVSPGGTPTNSPPQSPRKISLAADRNRGDDHAKSLHQSLVKQEIQQQESEPNRLTTATHSNSQPPSLNASLTESNGAAMRKVSIPKAPILPALPSTPVTHVEPTVTAANSESTNIHITIENPTATPELIAEIAPLNATPIIASTDPIPALDSTTLASSTSNATTAVTTASSTTATVEIGPSSKLVSKSFDHLDGSTQAHEHEPSLSESGADLERSNSANSSSAALHSPLGSRSPSHSRSSTPTSFSAANANANANKKKYCYEVEVIYKKEFPPVPPYGNAALGDSSCYVFEDGEQFKTWLLSKICNLAIRYKELENLYQNSDNPDAELIRSFEMLYQIYHPNYAENKRDLARTLGQALSKAVIKNADIDIEREIAKGAFGIVSKATYGDRTVATKSLIFDAKSYGNWKLFEDFIWEYQIQCPLQHPNIVSLLGLCLDPFLLIFEWLPTGTLYDYIESHQDLTEVTRDTLALDVAKGLAHLHANNPIIVHRDLKTPNVLVSLQGADVHAKIGDFGTALFLPESQYLPPFDLGNPIWAAPEVMLKQYYDYKIDTYALGIILWEIASGRKPFEDFTHFSKIEESVTHGYRDTIPTGHRWTHIIGDLWQHEPWKRPLMAEVIASLRAARNNRQEQV